MAKRNKIPDLSPYLGCQADEWLGIDPLAIGWLQHNVPFQTGQPPAQFIERLAPFCTPDHLVCAIPAQQPCPLCRKKISLNGTPLGHAEIRVIGDEEIFAAPDLIIHYVTEHRYLPPKPFLTAVLNGPQPTSSEYKALLRTYLS